MEHNYEDKLSRFGVNIKLILLEQGLGGRVIKVADSKPQALHCCRRFECCSLQVLRYPENLPKVGVSPGKLDNCQGFSFFSKSDSHDKGEKLLKVTLNPNNPTPSGAAGYIPGIMVLVQAFSLTKCIQFSFYGFYGLLEYMFLGLHCPL